MSYIFALKLRENQEIRYFKNNLEFPILHEIKLVSYPSNLLSDFLFNLTYLLLINYYFSLSCEICYVHGGLNVIRLIAQKQNFSNSDFVLSIYFTKK